LAFFISNSEFNFDFEKILFSSISPSDTLPGNLKFFRFYLIGKLCGLSSINKISAILGNLNLNSNNNNDADLMKYLPKENKPNWK